MNINSLNKGGGRNYSVDLLKIISMMMVVVLHLNLFGGLITNANQSDTFLFKFTVNFYEALCYIAVNVFVIISSWFLSAKNSFSLKSNRVLHLVVSMFFWYIVMTLVAYFLGIRPSFKALVASAPLIGKSYGFIAGYIVLFFLSPFLNRLTSQLNHNSHKKLALILFFVFSLCAPIITNQYIMVNKGYNFVWFICIYLIVSYVQKYSSWKKVTWKWNIMVLVTLVLMGSLARCFIPSGCPIIVAKGRYCDPFVFMTALTCFMLFFSFRMKRQKMINVVRFFIPLSVAVFFIHANMFIEQWFKSLEFYRFINENTLRYMICLPLLALAVYFVCTICEYSRIWLFEKAGISKSIERLSLSLDKYLVF